MRDITKAKVTGTWSVSIGRLEIGLCQVRKGKRGAAYVCFPVIYGHAFPSSYTTIDILVKAKELNALAWRDARDLRLPQLAFWAKTVGELLSEQWMKQEIAEQVLDLLYGVINSRINK